MPTIHYPGLISKEEAAQRKKVQVRAINDQVKRKTIAHVRIDGFVYIKDDHYKPTSSSPIIATNKLLWVPHVARKNKFIPERLYEEIIIGKITEVVVVDHVFVIEDDPELLHFLKTVKKRVMTPWYSRR